MKSEQQIKEEANKIVEQAKPLSDTNPRAYDKLTQRAITLFWVLEYIKSPKTLTLKQMELDILEALY